MHTKLSPRQLSEFYHKHGPRVMTDADDATFLLRAERLRLRALRAATNARQQPKQNTAPLSGGAF